MTLWAKLISLREGFGRPRVIPTLRHNPGDLRHSPHSQHPGGPAHANDIGTIDSDADGWADLERQGRIYAERGLTLAQAIGDFAPDNENDTAEYLAYIAEGLHVSPNTPMNEVLKISA